MVGLTCPTRTCWRVYGKRMDSMTSSCVNGALCCPTRGREGKICRRIYDAQNPGCPKQFRPCRQVQLLIVSLVLHLFLHCYSCFADSLSLSLCCEERCNPPIDGSDCQRDGRSSQDRSWSQSSLEDQRSARIVAHLEFPSSP